MTRIGLLPFGSPSNDYDRSLVEAFRFGLREVGVVEDRDVTVPESLRARATEIVE